MKKAEWRRRIFLAVTVLVIAFIFSQSSLSFSQSEEESGRIVKWLLGILSHVGITCDPEWFHLFVRKAAHVAEFALLGICVGGYAQSLGQLKCRRYYALPLWLTLMVAVCDEFIQSFTGRGSAVADVLLDYAGALLGLLIVAVFVLIKRKITRHQAHKN